MCLYTDCTFDSVPDLVILLELLADVNYMWYEIGTMLRVPSSELESLRQKNIRDSNKMKDVLQCWINQRTTKVSWDTIIATMKSKTVGKDHVAKEIKKYVSNANPSGETPSKRMVTLDASTSSSSKKYSRVLVEPQRSKYSM